MPNIGSEMSTTASIIPTGCKMFDPQLLFCRDFGNKNTTDYILISAIPAKKGLLGGIGMQPSHLYVLHRVMKWLVRWIGDDAYWYC